jgi:hypothetical protein
MITAKKARGALALLVLVSSFAASAQEAAAGPNPADVYVESISYGGTGCPQGTVAQSFSNDRTAFTLIFDSYIASTGPGLPITESRKACQLNVNLHVPQGWSFAIASVDYRGFVQLPAGATASQEATYYFSGQTVQSARTTNFVGPIARDYLVQDQVPLLSLVWSQCNAVRPLNIKSAVAIVAGSSQSAQITTDSIDGKVKTLFKLAWIRC